MSGGSPPDFVVTGGGQPSSAQAVAIAVALRELSHQLAEVAAEPPAPAWARAALLEGVGSERIVAPQGFHTGSAPGRVWGSGGTS